MSENTKMSYPRHLIYLVVLGMATLLASVTAYPAAPASSALVREVLPSSVIPVHYDLLLSPDADALTFRGRVSITVEVQVTTSAVTLNAEGLRFEHASADGGQDGTVTFDEKLGRATIALDAPLQPGTHHLSIDYSGKIGQSTLGFFAMDYSGADGPRRTLATNFEPAAARQLLPCWDEPGRKATFTISIDAPKDRMALSNMPITDSTSLSATMQRVHFAQTPKMSTYLLFVAVGDFERIGTPVDGVDLGVVVKRGDTGKAGYALEQARRILHFYNDYFGVAFPLPKLDLIAAPGQITGGSMENWGAIFYSQNHLLFDPKSSTEEDRQTVFLVVSHEMAHQWFGDLVTMAWWDNLWLNEGFARWMQTFAADALHPEWEIGVEALSIFERGKQADAVPSTHPVVQPVFTAEQASQSFDSITYDKGAAIITMINAYVGRDKFRDGVRRYMRAHAYGNTVDTDLWRLVQQAVGRPIVAIERDFTAQEGVPLVRVVGRAGGIHLAQTRFAADPATIADLAPQHWRLPLAVARIGATPAYRLLHETENIPEPPPVIVNAGQTAYARVLYDDELLGGLAEKMAALGAADQLGLLNDEYALGIAGYSSPDRMLKPVCSLPVEANPIVWQRVLAILVGLDEHYGDTPARSAFRRFALDRVAPLAARLGAGAADEPANVTILRSTLSRTRAGFGDAGVLAEARSRIAANDGSAAEQRTALQIVAQQADSSTFDRLVARANGTSDPLEKQHIFQALADVRDPTLASRMLDIALSKQVPTGSAPSLVTALSRRHSAMVWDVLVPRLDDPTLPFEKTLRWRIAATVASNSSDPKRIGDLEAYEAHSVPPEARKPFLEAVAAIRQNRRITTEVLPQLDRWIAAREPHTR